MMTIAVAYWADQPKSLPNKLGAAARSVAA